MPVQVYVSADLDVNVTIEEADTFSDDGNFLTVWNGQERRAVFKNWDYAVALKERSLTEPVSSDGSTPEGNPLSAAEFATARRA